MVDIYICDDQEVHLLSIKKIVENYISFVDIPMKISLATTKPEEIIPCLEPNGPNIYFLDIDLDSKLYDGLQLALKIRKVDPLGFIIFVTSHVEFGMLTFEYKLGAFDYIVKSQDIELFRSKIHSVLEALVDRYKNSQYSQENKYINSQGIKFVSDHENQYILIKDIIMLEVIGNHKLRVVSKHRMFECVGILRDFEVKLPSYFFRCHRSVIVNLKEVVSTSTKNEVLVLSNGMQTQCSTRKQKKCEKILDSLNL